MAKKKYLEESERKLIESVNNAYIPTDWDEFEKRYHEMERYGDGKPRKVDKEKMEYIEDGLVSRGIGGNQLSSLLSTIVEESGGNPFSVDDSGKFRGLIQFSKERYPEKDFSRDKKAGWKKAVDNQLDAIVDHLNEYGGDYGFLDGGDGSGYMTGEEAKDAFWGRDSDIENVTRALTYGFVRPGDRSGTTENRTRVARLINEIIQPPVETPDILEFDYDGKHYKATKPEEVTPEMRRALMLSKLVGEKNNIELQDSLYTTFNEAYGRAKNKGAGVFMWNGKKYSTKEDGGEVKDMEKFSKMLESLYNEDVERVRNGERAQYFGILNDKPLENVYPEFDLISKPTNVVYKGADMIADPISKVASSGASGFLEKELAGPVYWTKKLGDFMKALYFGVTRPIFNSLPESAKPLARQVFKHLYQWRHFTLPDTVRLSRELFGGEDEPESFDAAFKAAREQGLDTFEWNGNEYSTEIKKEGGDVWTKENEEDFQKWYAKIAEYKGLNPDPDDENQYYDYRTYWLENPEVARKMLEDDPEAHFTDRYKYPGHPTFSDESMYADEEHPGGHWETVDGIGYYVPSEYTKSYIDRTIQYLAGQNEGVYVDGEYRLIPKMPDGGASRLAPQDNTSVGRPGPADVQPVKPSAAARENPVVPFVASLLPGIGDVIDAHDFIQAAANKDRLGMALAAAGFIPVVGDVLQEAVRLNRARKLAKSMDEGLSIKPTYIIEESDRELLSKMPEYAHPNSPYAEAYDYHVQRLKDKAYEEATGRAFASHARNKYGIEETVPGVYDKVFDIGDEAEDLRPVAMDKAELPDYLDYMINPNNISSLVQDLRRESGNSPMMVVGTNHSSIVKDSKSKYYEMISGDLENQAKSHELDHIVKFRSPKKYLEGIRKYDDWFDLDKSGNPSYFENGLELAARGSQIKDYFGLTNSSQKVTADMLKYAARHYTDDVTNNNMVGFFNGIKDWDKAAEWISKYATAFTGATLIPRIMDDAGVDEKKEKEREFVRQFTSGGHSSKYDVLNFDGSLLGRDYKPFSYQGRALKWRSDYIKKVLQDKYGLSKTESGGLVDSITPKSLLSDRYYDLNTMSYGIGAWRRRDLFHFLKQYSDGGLADQIDFLAKEYLKEKEISGGFDAQSGVFDRRQWVVKRIGNEEFYTNSPLLRTLPSMSREDVALSLLPPELWPGILKRKEDVTGKSARKHFVNGGETSELQDYIYDRLTKEHGIAPIQAIGIVANLTQESALDYDALGDNGRSYGIQQWQGDRRKNLFEFAKKRGRDKPALDDQVDFLVEEYKGDGFLFPTRGENMYKTGKTDKDMFDYFQYSKLDFDNAANIYDSTRAWAQGFGRGNKNFLNMDRRFHIAKTLSSRYNIDAGGQSFYTDMGYKDEWGSPIPEVAVSAEKKSAQDDWMEKYGNKMLASILAGDGEGGNTHVTNNYYVNEEGLSEDEKRNAAEVRELQQKQQAQELLASIIDGIKLDIKGVTEVGKR